MKTPITEKATKTTDWITGEAVVPAKVASEIESSLYTAQGLLARLCRSVSRRMMPDEPTPEDRMELREAFDAASKFLHNDQGHATARGGLD